MINLAVLLLFFQLGSPVASFRERMSAAVEAKKPILTIFSATWCMPCQAMKKNVIEPLRASGGLDSVSVVYVDVSKDTEFTKTHIGTDFTIPKILLFFKEDEKWLKYELTGYQSKDKILEIIELQKKRNK